MNTTNFFGWDEKTNTKPKFGSSCYYCSSVEEMNDYWSGNWNHTFVGMNNQTLRRTMELQIAHRV